MELKTLFSKHFEILTENERFLFEYIINNKLEMPSKSISELSEEVHISTSSISRFCQKIGFSGYSEFRYYVGDVVEKTKPKKLNQTASEFLMDDLQNTQKIFNQANKQMLVDWLENANIIFCYGTGMGQKLVIKDFIRKMLLLKKIVIEIDAPTELDYYSYNVKENDVLMIFSLSGNIKNIRTPVSLFKQRGTKIIGVSKLGQSILSDISDFNLYYQSEYLPDDIDRFISFLPNHFLTDLIILEIKNRRIKEENNE